MGIFKRKTIIGRSSLSKEDIDRLIDLQDPYRTDYSYVRSRSYRRDGPEAYENPRMFRYSLNYYKRKWALEDAWNHGVLTYLTYYMMDYCGQMAHNRSTFFRKFYRVFYFFFYGFLSQQRRQFYDLNISSERYNSTTLSDSFALSQDSHYENEDSGYGRSIVSKFLYRFFRTLIYIFTLGYYPRSYYSAKETLEHEDKSGDESFQNYYVQEKVSQVSTSESSNISVESQLLTVSQNLDAPTSRNLKERCSVRERSSLLPLLLGLLLAFLIGRWMFLSDGEGYDTTSFIRKLRDFSIDSFGEGLEMLRLFGLSFVHTLLDLPSSVLESVSRAMNWWWKLIFQFFYQMCPFAPLNLTDENGYARKDEEAELKRAAEFGELRRKESDLYRLLNERESWSNQLAELKRERELNQEQFEQLKRSIDMVQSSFYGSSKIDSERFIGQKTVDEESFLKRIEKAVLENLSALNGRIASKEKGTVDTFLKSEFDKLAEKLQSRIEFKLRQLTKEGLDARSLLANEIADLGADIAVLRDNHVLMKKERDLKVAELVNTMNRRDLQQREDFKSLLNMEIKSSIQKLVIEELEKRLSVRLDEGEATMRARLLAELKNIVSEMLDERVNREESSTVNHRVGKIIFGGRTLSVSDYAVIRLMISEALRKYDADKTGKVDYALESSGASVLSTRCTEAYNQKSRVESIFGFPLWYSSYSPRQVIQHRTSFASGECWAFRGTGYLVVKLAYPIYVTEISYEHLPLCLHAEGNTRSAPKSFQIWSLREADDLASKILIGEYEYDNKGEALQTFPAQHTPHDPTPIIEMVVHSNWDADYTCLYRLRVHGRKPANGTIEPFPEVDHGVREETVKKTESIHFTGIKDQV